MFIPERLFLIFLLIFTIFTPYVTFTPVNIDNNQENNDSKNYDIEKINSLNIPFIKNTGQINSDKVKYYVKTFAGTVFVTENDLTYSFMKDTTAKLTIKERFVDGIIQPRGIEQTKSIVNYFVGEKNQWKINMPTFQIVNLGNVWSSIDVTVKAHSNNIEKFFTVYPGGNLQDIKLQMDGIKNLELSDDGKLVVNSDLGQLLFSNPIAFQYKGLEKVYVDAHYDVLDAKTYGFKIQNYDPQYPLIIDPLIASTFIGGSAEDIALDITKDSSGNLYITGKTTSSDYPTTTGAYSNTKGVDYDAFVSKFNSALNTLIVSTFIGGNGYDLPFGIVLDRSGSVYITGETDSTDYPTTTGAYDTTAGGEFDVFVSKFNSNLSTLSASTFAGSSLDDLGLGITLDSSGNVYITGETESTNYPTTAGAYDTSFNGALDVFVSKFNSNLSTLSASTFIGGSTNDDHGENIVLGSSGSVYITGETVSSDYPTTSGAFDTSHNGGDDVFVSKFNSDLSTLSASTFIGGNEEDDSISIVFDGTSDGIYITGETKSTNYPTTTGAYDTSFNGAIDAFVSKFNSNLSTLSASTFIGGSMNDGSQKILLNSDNVLITGYTSSTNYPTVSGAFDTSHNGGDDIFVSKLSTNLSTLNNSTFIGSSNSETGHSMISDDSGNLYITGYTNSTGYPTTSGAYDTSYNGGTYDVILSNIDCNLSGVACLQQGETVSITVSAGGTATVDSSEGNTVSVTLPDGVSGTITFTETTDGSATAADLEFLGSILDITTTAVGTKTISFTFTQEQANTAGITPSQVKIFEDINEDGSFQTTEALDTTVTGSGPFTARANSDFQSKFAVGGVVSANVVAGAGATLGFLQRDTCDPDGFGSGISLKLYKISYDVASANKLWVEAGTTCGPIKLQIVSYGKIISGGISMNQPKLDKKIILLEAPLSADQKTFSIVLKDKRDDIEKNFRIDKPVYEKDYMKIEQWSSQINSTSIIKPTNATKISTDSSVVIPSWIRNNAKWWSNGSVGDTDFVQGMQYLVRNDIVHIPTTKDTSSETSKQIPIWIKSNAGWWADKKISDDEFIKGMQWLISKKIISVT